MNKKLILLIALLCAVSAQELIVGYDLANKTNFSFYNYTRTVNVTASNTQKVFNGTQPFIPAFPGLINKGNFNFSGQPPMIPIYDSNNSNFSNFKFYPPNHYYHWPSNESDKGCPFNRSHHHYQNNESNQDGNNLGHGYMDKNEKGHNCMKRFRDPVSCLFIAMGVVCFIVMTISFIACCRRNRRRQFQMVRNSMNQGTQQIQMQQQSIQQHPAPHVQFPPHQQQIPQQNVPIIVHPYQMNAPQIAQPQQFVYTNSIPFIPQQQMINQPQIQQQNVQPIMFQAMDPNGQQHMIIGIPVIRPQQQQQSQQPQIVPAPRPQQVEQEEKKDEPVIIKSKYPELQGQRNIQAQIQQPVMGIPQVYQNIPQYNYPSQQN